MKGFTFTPAQQKTTNNSSTNSTPKWRAGSRGATRADAALLLFSLRVDDAEVTALDRVSIAGWLDERGLNSPRLRWWIDYACRDDYGMTLEQTSAWAGLFTSVRAW